MNGHIDLSGETGPRVPVLVGAIAAVGLSTALGLVLAPRWGTSAVDLLYLPAVLLAAVWGGLRPALLAAAASALAYNYFFTAPHLTFRIDSPNDVLTVVTLFVVAAVTSDLASRMRRQAQLARAEAARNATIAGLAGQLLSCASERAVADAATRELSAIFNCNAALLVGADGSDILASAPGAPRLTPADAAVAALVLDGGGAAGRGVDRAVPTEWQMHPVRSGSTTLAVLAMARDDGTPPVRREQLPLLASLLDQIALAMDRARLEADKRDFVRTRERDRIRSALLSSIGRDLSPPLKEIGRAVAQMRRSGTGDRDLLALVADQSVKLQRYLDGLADLDSVADQQPIEIDGLVIDIVRRTVTRDGGAVHLTPKEFALLTELAKHPGSVLSHAHLLRAVWGPAQEGQIDYLRVAIRSLRQKLERDPSSPRIVVNEPAVGYKLAG
jgi:two-component system sensor histidine kinase KdpD